MLGRIPRTATVTALTECRCDRIEAEAMLDALTALPPSSSLMETATLRLDVTHPARSFDFVQAEPEPEPEPEPESESEPEPPAPAPAEETRSL